jgi:hypothetical protein
LRQVREKMIAEKAWIPVLSEKLLKNGTEGKEEEQ